jgi:purine-binding chemotaxis protein CheW
VTHSAPAPDDAAEQLLLERARLLAGASSAPAPQAELAAVVCRVRQELYAIELGSSVAVLAANGITGVPCTPPHIAGVLNVRGDIVTMLDLAAALGLGASPPTHSDSARVVLIEHQRGRLGLLVDEVQEIRRSCSTASNDPCPIGRSGHRRRAGRAAGPGAAAGRAPARGERAADLR